MRFTSAKHGTGLVKVNRYFPSSKLCSQCGYRHAELPFATGSGRARDARLFSIAMSTPRSLSSERACACSLKQAGHHLRREAGSDLLRQAPAVDFQNPGRF